MSILKNHCLLLKQKEVAQQIVQCFRKISENYSSLYREFQKKLTEFEAKYNQDHPKPQKNVQFIIPILDQPKFPEYLSHLSKNDKKNHPEYRRYLDLLFAFQEEVKKCKTHNNVIRTENHQHNLEWQKLKREAVREFTQKEFTFDLVSVFPEGWKKKILEVIDQEIFMTKYCDFDYQKKSISLIWSKLCF